MTDHIHSPTQVKLVRWSRTEPPSEQEVEAWLHKEGYQSFRWMDVAGSHYPKHAHDQDECLWLLQGEMKFTVHGETHHLKPGDRLYLPKHTIHTAENPNKKSAVYLVGKK